MIKIYFDGSCTKNPGGTAGYGFVIDIDGVLTQRNGIECKGELATNNLAEFAGLKHALQYVLHDLKYTGDIEIYGDSQLVVNQVSMVWKCRAEHLKPYFKDVRKLLGNFESWTIHWIPREQNTLADALSKV